MCEARSSTAPASRSSSSSVVKKPTPMRNASRLGIVRAMAKTRAPSSSSAACAVQPAIRNVTSVAIRVVGVRTLTPGIAARRVAARAAREWARSDELREDLAARGVLVEDTRDGQRWRRSEAAR